MSADQSGGEPSPWALQSGPGAEPGDRVAFEWFDSVRTGEVVDVQTHGDVGDHASVTYRIEPEDADTVVVARPQDCSLPD